MDLYRKVEVIDKEPKRVRVGDVVTVKKDLTAGEYDGGRVFSHMVRECAGEGLRVTSADKTKMYVRAGDYWWTEGCFDLVKNCHTLYRVGDKVKVKSTQELTDTESFKGELLGRSANTSLEMVAFGGKTVTISEVSIHSCGEVCYRIEGLTEGPKKYYWVSSMFEGLVTYEEVKKENIVEYSCIDRDNSPVVFDRANEVFKKYAISQMKLIKIIFSGNKTIVFYRDSEYSEIVKKMIVKCHEDDSFNKDIGFKIAVLRITKKITEEYLRGLEA